MAAEAKKLKPAAAEPDTDRLSALPEDILRHILIAADLDLKTTAQTSVLSRRWRHLWRSALREIRLETPRRREATVRNRQLFTDFVDNVLAAREPGSELALISITVNDAFDPKYDDLLGRIYEYGSAHGARAFRQTIRARLRTIVETFPYGFVHLCRSLQDLDLSLLSFDFDELCLRSFNFACLTALRLDRCELFVPPALYAAVATGGDYEPFAGIPNLKKVVILYIFRTTVIVVVLIDCVFEAKNAAKVSGEKLEEIRIEFCYEPHLFVIKLCAPNATKLTLGGVTLSRFSDVELPSLEFLDIDVWVRPRPKTVAGRARRALQVSWEQEWDAGLRFLSTFEKFGRAMCVKLRPRAIEGLTMVPGLLEGLASPFKRIKSVEFCGSLPCSRSDFVSLIGYFFNQCLSGGAHISQHSFASQERGVNDRLVLVLRRDGDAD
ncbi:unnamed protein product [Linum tenue]|uniref:F-box domain-containing protein n=1 Tax=Linum tenue TaxID=586396 RepID=A0AAV0JVM8_9ROSI|nr:unnamed protein product [Linum tenue]